jgi:hypothetical protein
MLGQQIGVAVTELVQQPRRALDVGEEKGDSAGRKIAHGPMMKRRRPRV